MTTHDVLAVIVERGIFPAVVRGRLVLIEYGSGKKTAVTPKLLRVLKYHRAKLIDILKDMPLEDYL